jgi:hypothetical protein
MSSSEDEIELTSLASGSFFERNGTGGSVDSSQLGFSKSKKSKTGRRSRKGSKRGSKSTRFDVHSLNDEIRYDGGIEYIEWKKGIITEIHEPTDTEPETTYTVQLKGEGGEPDSTVQGVKAEQLKAKHKRNRNVSDIRLSVDGSSVKMSREKTRGVMCARLYVVTLAILSLWASSLSFCRFLVGIAVPQPKGEDVYCVCEEAYKVSSEYNAFYEDCVACNVDECNAFYTLEIEQELLKVSTLESENRAIVEATLLLKERCSTRRRAAQALLSKYNENGLPWIEAPGSRDNALCTYDEDDQLVLNGVQNVDLARGDAVDVADGYERSSTGNVNTLADYIPERSQYDADYLANKSSFIDVTVGSIPLELKAAIPDITGNIVPSLGIDLNTTVYCLSPDPPADFDVSVCPGIAAAETIQRVLDDAQDNLDGALEAGEELLAQSYNGAKAYQRDAEERIEQMNDQILALESSINAAQATLDGLDVVGLPDLNFPDPTGSFPLPDFYDGDFPIEIDTGFVDQLPTAADMAAVQAVDDVLGNIYNATANVATGVGESFSAVGDSIADTADVVADAATPNDYDPPICCGEDGESEEDIRARQEAESNMFNSQHTASINAFGESSTNDDLSSYNPPTFNTSNFDLESLITQSTFTWDFIPLDAADFPANWLLLQIDGLWASALLLDIAWRVFRSVQIFIRYYSKTTVIGKPIDMRVEKVIMKGCGNCIPTTYTQTIQRILLSPFTPAVIGLFLMWLFILLLVNIYVPFFNDYTEGCVENGQLVTSCDAILTQDECVAAFAAQAIPCKWQPVSDTRGIPTCVWDRNEQQYPTPDDFKYGTFVENNLYSVAYNYASESGNNEYW